MAYKKGGGCQPITAKLKYTTKGGVVDPLLNLGSPAKMKMHSPAKATKSHPNAEDTFGIGNKKAKTGFAGDTPYSAQDGKGTIHGPKSSYDAAYKKRDRKVYGEMSKSEYIKEAKRQTKSFESTGKFDAPKAKKAKTVSVIKPKVTIETKKPTATIDVKVTKTAKPTKNQARKTKSIDKKLAKAKAAREAGNIKKAERKEKRAAKKQARINKRAAKKNSPAAKKGCYSK